MFELKTVALRPDGCFSTLCVAEKGGYQRPFAGTCERTFENLRTVLVSGVYRCVKTHFIRGNYGTFEILAPGHSRVLFHRGNLELHSEGCVLIGKAFTVIDKVCGIRDSVAGFREFWELARDLAEFTLTVSGRP